MVVEVRPYGKYWRVYVNGEYAPPRQYVLKADAEAEAQRLRDNP